MPRSLPEPRRALPGWLGAEGAGAAPQGSQQQLDKPGTGAVPAAGLPPQVLPAWHRQHQQQVGLLSAHKREFPALPQPPPPAPASPRLPSSAGARTGLQGCGAVSVLVPLVQAAVGRGQRGTPALLSLLESPPSTARLLLPCAGSAGWELMDPRLPLHTRLS